MILVDSSVWIDFFRNKPTAQAEWLDRNLGTQRLIVGDLILAEVLQGFRDDRGFNEAKRMLGLLEKVEVAGFDIAIESARNYRKLRSMGVTVRGTLDVLIATRCIASGYRLLHNDRDFDAFERHLTLRVVNCEACAVDHPLGLAAHHLATGDLGARASTTTTPNTTFTRGRNSTPC